MIRVAVMFTAQALISEGWAAPDSARRVTPGAGPAYRLLGQVRELRQERIGRGEPQRDADADDERCVDQAQQQEHLGLQLTHQFGLARGGLQVLAGHDADADARAGGTQTDDQADANRYETDEFHV